MFAGAPTLPPEPARQLRGWRMWLIVWRVHRLLGLGLGAVVLLLSATGSLLVVHHELERVFERDLHVAPTAAARQPPALADLARQAVLLAPSGYRLFRVFPAVDPQDNHRIVFRASESPERWDVFVDPATGGVIWSGPEQNRLTPWVLGLHMQLHAGRTGYYVTGAAGVGLALLALTGLYLHRDRYAQLWRHPFRVHLGWRVAVADLHKWVGVFLLYFPVVLGITGTIYCVSILTADPPRAVGRPFNPAGLAPLEPMFAAAREKLPGTEILRAQLPAEDGGPVTVLLLHRSAPVWKKFSRVEFDATTGILREVRAAADGTWTAQFRSMLAPLHFGFYGANWVKWAYFIGGLAPAILALSGALIWWLRRRSARHGLAKSRTGTGVYNASPPQ